jgi:large subunit ribosomal protein L5
MAEKQENNQKTKPESAEVPVQKDERVSGSGTENHVEEKAEKTKSVKVKPAKEKPESEKSKAKQEPTKAPSDKKKAAKSEKRTGKEPSQREAVSVETKPILRLYVKYKNEIIPALMKQFSYKNVNQVPKVVKISVNVGMGKALQNNKLLESAADDLAVITGQKPIITIAKKSISNFKLRAGNPIGCKVTLRRERMYEFLDRLITIAIPRIRDFRGIFDKAFDGFGNYTLGIKEQIIFPEINYDKVESIHGMDITIVTNAKTDEEARALLKLFGMPFVEASESMVTV